MKSKLPLLLGLSAVLLATSCSAATTSDKSDSTASSQSAVGVSSMDDTKATASATASPNSVKAEDIIPTLSRPQADEDHPAEKIDDPSIDPANVRALAPLSYANEFVAVNDSDELCLIGWANSGDGDGTATTNGPKIDCKDPAAVKKDGLSLSIKRTSDNPGVVLAMLPPDLTEDVARSVLLKIPGNHEDLRPPVEFDATDFGIVSVAMDPETAKKLGSITFPRKDGTKFTLKLS